MQLFTKHIQINHCNFKWLIILDFTAVFIQTVDYYPCDPSLATISHMNVNRMIQEIGESNCDLTPIRLPSTSRIDTFTSPTTTQHLVQNQNNQMILSFKPSSYSILYKVCVLKQCPNTHTLQINAYAYNPL